MKHRQKIKHSSAHRGGPVDHLDNMGDGERFCETAHQTVEVDKGASFREPFDATEYSKPRQSITAGGARPRKPGRNQSEGRPMQYISQQRVPTAPQIQQTQTRQQLEQRQNELRSMCQMREPQTTRNLFGIMRTSGTSGSGLSTAIVTTNPALSNQNMTLTSRNKQHMSAAAWRVKPPAVAASTDTTVSNRHETEAHQGQANKFVYSMSRMINSSQNNRKYQCNKEVFEEVARNLPIFSEQADAIRQQFSRARRTKNKTSVAGTYTKGKSEAGYIKHTSFVQQESEPNILHLAFKSNNYVSDEGSPHALQQLAVSNQKEGANTQATPLDVKLASYNTDSPPVGGVVSGAGHVRSFPSHQRLLINSQQTESNLQNAPDLQEHVRRTVTTEMQHNVTNLASDRSKNRRVPFTAKGSRQPILLKTEDPIRAADSSAQQDFADEAEKLFYMLKKAYKNLTNTQLMYFDKAKVDHVQWTAKKLVILSGLDSEISLNFDMFETARGQFKMDDPRLANKELNRNNLSNWGHQFLLNLIRIRELDHPDCDLVKSFAEATWILRSVMILLKTDRQLQQIIAVVWKSIISHVDMELAQVKGRLDDAEERIWNKSKKHFEGVIRKQEDTEMTLRRNLKEQEAEVSRLTKLDKESSGKEVTLNNGLYELRQIIEDLKDQREVNKFKQKMMDFLVMIDELDHKKKFQYSVVESSLKLMCKNLKEPDEVIVQGDGSRRKSTKRVVSQHTDAATDWMDSKQVVYHNIYGMNPAKGSADYDLTGEANRAQRAQDIVNDAMAVQTDHLFKQICGDKLTEEEMKQLKQQIIQTVTPAIEAQVRAQVADQMVEMVKISNKKLLSKVVCRQCGAKVVDADGKGFSAYEDTDSDLDIQVKKMKAGVDVQRKIRKKRRRVRTRDDSDSDYEVTYDAVTGAKKRVAKAEEVLYEIDPVTGKARIDPKTGMKVRNKKRPFRKEFYSTGESSYESGDLYQVDGETGQFKLDKNGERVKKADKELYVMDARTGKPKIDPDTGKPIRRYSETEFVIDSETGEPVLDRITGKKVRRQKLSADDYELDSFGKPRLDTTTGRPIRKRGARGGPNKVTGKWESESETEYEIDLRTGKARVDPKTGWPIPKTKIRQKKVFAEDDYDIDAKTGKPKIDPTTGRPVKKRLGKRDQTGKFVEDSEETEYEIDETTGKPLIDPKTGWPVPKVYRDPRTGKPVIDPSTGKPVVMRRRIKNLDDGETEYEVDEKTGQVKIDKKTGKPVPKYVIDQATGKPKIDPATGRPVVQRKAKPVSEGETEYEYDEKTGQLKIDKKTGQPIPKYVLDPKTGKPAVDPKTGKPMVMRRGKESKYVDGPDKHNRGAAAGGDSDSYGSTYEVDWQKGKYVKNPATGEYVKDPSTGRRVKVKKVGGKSYQAAREQSEYEIDPITGNKMKITYEIDPQTGQRVKKRKKVDDVDDGYMNVAKLNRLQADIDTSLEKAAISKSEHIKKKTVKEMRNPILDAIRQTLGVKGNIAAKDYKVAMKPNAIMSLMDEMICAKAIDDLKVESKPISKRTISAFTTFMYDKMLGVYGLPTLAVKTLIQLTNGINRCQEKCPYGKLLNKLIGMAQPALRADEVGIILRSHLFFKCLQEDWLHREKRKGLLEITDDMRENLVDGGHLLIFDAMEEIKHALKHDKQVMEHMLTTIKPDILLQKSDDLPQLSKDFAVLKVCTRIAKAGLQPAEVFDRIDADKSGTLSPQEILQGCKSALGVHFSTEEANIFTMWLDEDGSGDVDPDEFCRKVTLDGLHGRASRFTISETTFIDKMLSEWYSVQKREKEQVAKLVSSFDENGDGVYQLNEFKALMQHLEKDIPEKKIITLFKECVSLVENGQLNDAINADALYMMFMKYKIKDFGRGFFSDYLNKKLDQIMENHRKKKH